MRECCAAVTLMLLLTAAPAFAAGQAPEQPPQQPASPATTGQGTAPVPGQAGAPAETPQPLPARTFTAPAGLLFNTVRPDKVADFEKVLGYLKAALEASADPTIRSQAMGWRIFKAAEPGPGGTVLYVFAFDPTVRGADYGLGRILAEAYPDTAQLQEIWRLYQGAVTSGGSLLNLTPVMPVVPPPPSPSAPAGATAPPTAPVPAPPQAAPQAVPAR